MFQLFKDVFSLTSTPHISLAENWQEDIANQMRDLVRTDRMENRYVVWYKDDKPYFIFVVAPAEDRHYLYVKEHLSDEIVNGLRGALSEEGDVSKYILCSDLRTPIELAAATFQGVAIDIPGSVTDDVIVQFIGSAGEEVVRHRKTLAPGLSPVLFLSGNFTVEDIAELEQAGFKLGNLLYKF
ncbi:hypothetical protein STRATTON_285 [Erwinia phage vB_EamM_Stratton]|uniref:Uncharacterized protein n=1 Tax=Erwinia phage vB_EamM_Stratton TaxID=1883378 RepID=A0A1B2IHF0_9CAUD|nr:hypothetical protein STRATTON_285 [Erwinia phage vB_EamM_Stratton]